MSKKELEKEAIFADQVARGLSSGAAGAAVLGILSGFATAGALGYDAMKRKNIKGRGFDNMLSSNPDLNEEEKQKVKAYFDMIADFSPDLANNPIVAGNWVRSRLGMEGRVEANDIKSLVDTQTQIDKGNKVKTFLNEFAVPLKGIDIGA